jgi:hypothetical protein
VGVQLDNAEVEIFVKRHWVTATERDPGRLESQETDNYIEKPPGPKPT